MRTLLDGVERACAPAVIQRSGGTDALRVAVWDLSLAFVEHLAMEEADVAPVWRREGPAGEARARAMILEHNEQRRVMLELVEDLECDAKPANALVQQALALVRAFTVDMALEDRALTPPLPG
jgi:hypothetical protein